MNNAVEARRLLRAHRYGALSTLSRKLDGYPFGSITPYAVDHDGSLVILISGLAEHTKNIEHDPRVSLITHNQNDPNIQMQGRVTVVGNAHRMEDAQQAGERYLRLFPEAANYLTMADFSFYRIQPIAIRYIGGVGRIHWVRMPDYRAAQAVKFSLQEASLLNDINTRQAAYLRLLIQQYHGSDTPDTQAIALDCDGMDIRSNGIIYRLDFNTFFNDPEQILPLSEVHFPNQ